MYATAPDKTNPTPQPVIPTAYYSIAAFPVPVSPATIYRALDAYERTGRGLRPTRIGRRTLFSGRAILAWIGESSGCAVCGASACDCQAADAA